MATRTENTKANRVALSDSLAAAQPKSTNRIIRRLALRHWRRLLIRVLRTGNHVIEGRRPGKPGANLIPTEFFDAPFEFDFACNGLRALRPLNGRQSYIDVHIDAPLSEFLAERIPFLVGYTTREALLRRVRTTRMTPAHAEAKAAALELPPLAPRSNLDPMHEREWTLLMAIAWICYRAPQYVQCCWPTWRAGTWQWYENKPIRILPSMSFNGPGDAFPGSFRRRAMHRQEYGLPPPRVDPDAAKTILFAELIKGALECEGISSQTGRLETIPAKDFRHLDIQYDAASGDDVLGGRFIVYQSPTIRRDDLSKLWPPPRTSVAGSASSPAQARIQAEADCQAWLIEVIKASPERRTATRRDLYLEACRRFPAIGSPENVRPSAAFDRARKAAARSLGADKWLLGGAPMGKRAEKPTR